MTAEQPDLLDELAARGVAEGRARAEEGAARALAAQDDPHVVWRAAAEREIEGLIGRSRRGTLISNAGQGVFTADDVTALAGEPPHPNAMGGLFRSYRSQLVAVGYTESTRPAAHARVIRVWKAKP